MFRYTCTVSDARTQREAGDLQQRFFANSTDTRSPRGSHTYVSKNLREDPTRETLKALGCTVTKIEIRDVCA